MTRDGASLVFAVVDGVAQAKTVSLGQTRANGVIVRDGLLGNETLIAQPPDSLKAGDRVRAKGFSVSAVAIDRVRKVYQRDASGDPRARRVDARCRRGRVCRASNHPVLARRRSSI